MPTPKRPPEAEAVLDELARIADRQKADDKRRRELIREAVRLGASLRVVAQAAGISHQTVQTIVDTKKQKACVPPSTAEVLAS